METPPLAKCSVCAEKKEHFDSGITSPSGKVIFVDQDGRKWHDMKGKNKRMCPACGDKVCYDTGPLTELKRKCSDCQRVLTLKRYFKCEVCVPVLSDDDDPFLEDVEL